MNIPLGINTDIVALELTIGTPQEVSVGMTTAVEALIGDHYTGAYSVTPSASRQVLATDGLIMDGDITIEPIPSNYGLITWDGSIITVS